MDQYYEIGMEDSKYGQYFNNLEQFHYRPDGAAAADEVENREYSWFIENLKEDENGVSYTVEFPISSEISIVHRYEGEEEESFENVDRLRNFMSNSKREKAKVRENSGGFSGKARADTPKTTKKSLQIGVKGGKKRSGDVFGQKRKRDDEIKLEEGEESFENVDRQGNFMSNSKRENAKVWENFGGFSGKERADAEKFLENGVEGCKKRLDLSGQNRKRDDEIKQEEGEESFESLDRHRNFMSNSKREKAKVWENCGGFSGKSRADTLKTTKKSLEIGVEGGKKRLGHVSGQKRKRDDEKKLEEGAEADPVSCKSIGGSLKLMNCIMKDEIEAEVPDSFDKSGMNPELGNEKGHTPARHKNDGSCLEVEVFTLDDMPLLEGDYMPFVPSKCFVGEEYGHGIRGSGPFQFREKLMDLLKIPYNEQELSNLWRDVTKRIPVEGVKDLRNGRMKSYSTKNKGKSYLDGHETLKKKIEKFREDPCKVLYLLRGFFFWLKNICHEGAFQPWMDSLYLNSFD